MMKRSSKADPWHPGRGLAALIAKGVYTFDGLCRLGEIDAAWMHNFLAGEADLPRDSLAPIYGKLSFATGSTPDFWWRAARSYCEECDRADQQ